MLKISAGVILSFNFTEICYVGLVFYYVGKCE